MNILYKGACTNHVDSHGGRGGSWNVHFTNKAYLVKLSTKGGGGVKKVQKTVHMVCACPLIGQMELLDYLVETITIFHFAQVVVVIQTSSWFQISEALPKSIISYK